jgi:hypothetical protein
VPSGANLDPCAGQSQLRSPSFQLRAANRCGHTVDTAQVCPSIWEMPAGRSPRRPTAPSPSGTDAGSLLLRARLQLLAYHQPTAAFSPMPFATARGIVMRVRRVRCHGSRSANEPRPPRMSAVSVRAAATEFVIPHFS